MPQMEDKRPRTVDELVSILDKVICSGKGWLQSLPPRHDGEIPSINAAKQLAEEACEFATSVSDAIKRGNKVAAYANERLLVDRFLHAARFFEESMDVIKWSYWSIAEINQLANNAMSQGAVNQQDQAPTRKLLQGIRHWNRSEAGKDRQMTKPSGYDWHRTRREIVDDSNARLKSNYDITSTYAHPTYRGDRSPDPGQEYVLEQADLIACSTFIICGAQPDTRGGRPCGLPHRPASPRLGGNAELLPRRQRGPRRYAKAMVWGHGSGPHALSLRVDAGDVHVWQRDNKGPTAIRRIA